MFGDVVLETSWSERSRRSWTTLTSFAMQDLAMAFLIILSVAKPVDLPLLRQLALPVTLGASPGPPPVTQYSRATSMRSNLAATVITAPREVPRHIEMVEETVSAPQVTFRELCRIRCDMNDGLPKGLFASASRPMNSAVAPPPAPVAHPPRISRVMEGFLIYRVQPKYPTLARSARIQGTVVMSAIISKEGTIENLRVLRGHPMLVRAAIDAVSRWRYRPYLLNNEPVEVETQIMVNFSLSGG